VKKGLESGGKKLLRENLQETTAKRGEKTSEEGLLKLG